MKLRAILSFLMCTGTLLSVSAVAWAQALVSHTYAGTRCHGITPNDESALARYPSTGRIAGGWQSHSTTVVCPIIKTTSGPSAIYDDLSQVTVQGELGALKCSLFQYQTKPVAGFDSNLIARNEQQAGGWMFSLSVTANGFQTGFWGDSTSWKYAEMVCELESTTALVSYTVYEYGFIQPGHRIASAANCNQPASGMLAFHHGIATESSPANQQWGGFLEHDMPQQTGDPSFSVSCPSPAGAGAFVQVALGSPSLSSTRQMGCRNSANSTWQYIPGANGENPSPLFRSFNATSLVCEQSAGTLTPQTDGDGRIYAFRTSSSNVF